ncbi:hypothetical protein FPZ44_06605 [Paenibacillus agilis]|uniref:Butirosin biosynthesis protein H N-terminal domain-containing protein n=2 Tax=Paenibacillus agilis TaxID=3020863 RepID=A0A559IYP3_9BACL|nr:hypothetical protein FPZ44_06605 [Paenibacillus agilis]
MFFGAWDAPFEITEQGIITYYSDKIHHDHEVNWFTQLFKVAVTQWYDHGQDRQQNYRKLHQYLRRRPESRSIIAQLDMYYMPHMTLFYHKQQLPHYVILQRLPSGALYMHDPDFEWEGEVEEYHVAEAFLKNQYGGGFYIDHTEVREPDYSDIIYYFDTQFKKDCNELPKSVKQLFHDMIEEREGKSIQLLMPAVKQLGLIVLRKHSYEYAFSYFNTALQLDEPAYEEMLAKVKKLVKGWTSLQYSAIKVSVTGSAQMMELLTQKLDVLDELEMSIKRDLHEIYGQWKTTCRQEQFHV